MISRNGEPSSVPNKSGRRASDKGFLGLLRRQINCSCRYDGDEAFSRLRMGDWLHSVATRSGDHAPSCNE